MSAMASQVTGVSIVYSLFCSCADQRKQQSSASLSFVGVIHRWLLNSPLLGESTGEWWIPAHKGQWREALMFSLICARTNGWASDRDAGDLRRGRAHYGVTVMSCNPELLHGYRLHVRALCMESQKRINLIIMDIHNYRVFALLAFRYTETPAIQHDFHSVSLKSLARALLTLHLRHNDHDGVSSHQPQSYLLNRWLRRQSKKTSKLRATGLCVGNLPGTGEFPALMASNAENVSIWWRHDFLTPTHRYIYTKLIHTKYHEWILRSSVEIDHRNRFENFRHFGWPLGESISRSWRTVILSTSLKLRTYLNLRTPVLKFKYDCNPRLLSSYCKITFENLCSTKWIPHDDVVPMKSQLVDRKRNRWHPDIIVKNKINHSSAHNRR